MSSRTNGDRPLKLVSEAARERETFKYRPFLLSDSRYSQSGRPLPSSELTTSSDSVLTALAQLGTYQTATERALISLFDASHQYVIAEATPLTPLTSALSSDKCPAPLALCGTAISRGHGACEHALFVSPDPGSHDAAELPLSLVPDLTTDSCFSSKPLWESGELGRFYAAVPIRTSRGINIGVYCVLSPVDTGCWNDECTRRMRDISYAIMDHLEANRSRHAYRRNERMNRGLGSFIEGKSTLSGWQHGPNVAAFVDNSKLEGALDGTQQLLERQDQERKEQELRHRAAAQTPRSVGAKRLPGSKPIERFREAFSASYFDTSHKIQYPPHAGRPVEASYPGHSDEPGSGGTGADAVFSKAANIIREAFEVAGCLFFDVTLGSYSAPKVQIPSRGSDTEATMSQSATASSSEDQLPTSPAEEPDAACELLGFSTSDVSSINDAGLSRNEGFMPKRFLAKLLRRYPGGKIFNFDAIGELQSSDSSEDDGALKALTGRLSSANGSTHEGASTPAPAKNVAGRSSRAREGALLHQAFPGARSVAFIPVWDSKRERWFAGGFVYTLTPTRVFTIEGELSFLRAFARLIAAEMHNHETLQADKAKSDALGSLSHELRSPLHGVILGTELLNDTDLSVFQGNATHTIETCCRTLLDTIDHLLDYSKINSFATKRRQGPRATYPKSRQRTKFDQFGKKRLYTHARLDGLVEDVVESVFAGFNFQHMSIRQLSKQDRLTHTDTRAHNRLDFAQAMEQLGPSVNGGGEPSVQIGNVSIYLLIAPRCNWMFHMPGGAIRRIVMNLFGNSLKFTARGAIWISLSQEKALAKRAKADRSVKLTVQDTGKGINEDYLRHRLFKPFAQEDELAPGTGLGLSLVKTIVSELRGHIFVESQVGVGTTITVTLPLEQSPPAADLPEDDRDYEEQVRELKGLRVRLSGFGSTGASAKGTAMRTIVEDICRHSLHLDLVSEEQARHLAPDLVVWLDDALPGSFGEIERLAKTPNVVICQDALVAYQRFIANESAEHGGVFDFISQPVGPRKLAKSIKLAQPGARLPTNAADPAMDSEIQTQSAAEPEPPTPNGMPRFSLSILVVDDNHINLKILSAHMRKLGRAYETVVNGKEAVDAYTQNPTHWAGILMDISMPVMDGLEATRRIRGFEHRNQLRAVPILALTGLASDSAHREALESGVDVFLTKPVRLKALSENLETMKVLSLAQACGK
ncbi:histidine kinase-, DNA gyrase b-, and HSP90-like ATPase domain-containing protein [Hirsutella rhossiliensis]|uniref:histidine kinase n=1 Tax=Hirsutella rhossiliensis TaxID=111463 RepID=A0A9P8MVE2_9HYPO|nr:histidine kinase-, DNA gyrase b-, and HSP90-like ATPase domain-containing protein [Hirsutella rhossiliensis]KAH0962903.1 histidine kinase-, DNA gyrase b-, and HSP90-like ATPase domain-containing protein [Hirsutella rhossiliensis]